MDGWSENWATAHREAHDAWMNCPGLSTAVVLNLPTTAAFNTVPHVAVTPSHKIIFVATSQP